MKQTCQTGPASSESQKKKLRRKRAAQALAAGVAIAGGTQAYAVPVAHVNPPGAEHFDWGGAVGEPNWLLDILAPANVQPPGATAPGVFLHTNTVPSNVAGGGMDDMLQLDATYGIFAAGVDAGTIIPSGLPLGSQGYVQFYGYSDLPEGQQTYLGVRFDLGSGDQYGWIGVVRTGPDLDAFAWGYETDPGVPIEAGALVPEPGSLAMLAVGAAAMARRRRRSAE